MSSVWLTASAVRYMICRLLRARASQGLAAWSSSRRSRSLPAWLIARTIRELCRPLAPEDDVDLVRQVLCGVDHRPVKSISVRPNLHLVAAGQLLLLDPVAVDERAVGAAQVANQVTSRRLADFGVPARDFGVVQLDGVGRIAAQATSFRRPARTEFLGRGLE